MASLNLGIGKDGKVYPGWKMFFNEKLTFKEKPIVVIKEIQEEVVWVNYMDVEAIKTMMKTSGTCSPSPMKSHVILLNSSCLLWGLLIIGLGLGFLKKWGKSFLMQVPIYFSIFLIR